MATLEAPRIVTARTGYDDSFTLARFLATGGYEGLRKALTMFPEDVALEVDEASLLGRGGAGFPAGRKWSMLRKSPVSYLVVNGDESEPATFKDHLLLERDPHQIIEGIIISAYALQAAGEFRAAGMVAVIAPALFVIAVLFAPVHSLEAILGAYAAFAIVVAVRVPGGWNSLPEAVGGLVAVVFAFVGIVVLCVSVWRTKPPEDPNRALIQTWRARFR